MNIQAFVFDLDGTAISSRPDGMPSKPGIAPTVDNDGLAVAIEKYILRDTDLKS